MKKKNTSKGKFIYITQFSANTIQSALHSLNKKKQKENKSRKKASEYEKHDKRRY